MIGQFFSTILYDYTLRTVVLGTGILGITCGALGVFAFLRRQSLLGDAISHAALPGIACVFLLTHSRNPAVLMLGGALTGSIGTLFIWLITHKTTIKKDAALGIVLSVFFGLGLVLLTVIQKRSIAQQAILNKFLFGNASLLLSSDISAMVAISCTIFLCLFFFWKEFKLITYDQLFAYTLGYPVKGLDILLTFLLVFAIVMGLQTVGVILMSSMLIAPAAAARQWTYNFELMVILAAGFGAFSSVTGSIISSMVDQLPTGPTIVVVMSLVVLISLLCAPHRGILWHWWRFSRTKHIKSDYV